MYVVGVIGTNPLVIIAALSQQVLPQHQQTAACDPSPLVVHHDLPQRTLYVGLHWGPQVAAFDQAARGWESSALKAALLLFLSSHAIVWALEPGRPLETLVLGTLRLLQQAKQLLLPTLPELIQQHWWPSSAEIEGTEADRSWERIPMLLILCQTDLPVAAVAEARPEADVSRVQQKLDTNLRALLRRCQVLLPEENAAALCTLCPQGGVWLLSRLGQNSVQVIRQAFAALRVNLGGGMSCPAVPGLHGGKEGDGRNGSGSSGGGGALLDAPSVRSLGPAGATDSLRSALRDHATAQAVGTGLGFAAWHRTFCRLAAALQCNHALGLPALSAEPGRRGQQLPPEPQSTVPEGAAAALAWLEGCSSLTYQMSEAKCKLAAATARDAYLRSVPEIYPADVHGAAFQTAVGVYWQQGARGPAGLDVEAGLQADCESVWRDGRQQCQERSIWGHPCLLRPHTPQEVPHSSGVTYLLATTNGEHQVEVQDPFDSWLRTPCGANPRSPEREGGQAHQADSFPAEGAAELPRQRQQQDAPGKYDQGSEAIQQEGPSLARLVQPGALLHPPPHTRVSQKEEPPQAQPVGNAPTAATTPHGILPASSLLAAIPMMVERISGGSTEACGPPPPTMLGGMFIRESGALYHPQGCTPGATHYPKESLKMPAVPNPSCSYLPASTPAGAMPSGCFMEVHYLGPAAVAQGGLQQPGFLPGCCALHKFVLQVAHLQDDAMDEEFPALGHPTKMASSFERERHAVLNWPQHTAPSGKDRVSASPSHPPRDLGPEVLAKNTLPGQGTCSDPKGRGVGKRGRKHVATARGAHAAPAVMVGLEYESLEGQRTVLSPAQVSTCTASSLDTVVVGAGAGRTVAGLHAASQRHPPHQQQQSAGRHPLTDALADAAAGVVGAQAAAALAARRVQSASPKQPSQPMQPLGGPAAEFMLCNTLPLYLHLSEQQQAGCQGGKATGKSGRGSKASFALSSKSNGGGLSNTPVWWQLRRIFVATPASSELRFQACPRLRMEFPLGGLESIAAPLGGASGHHNRRISVQSEGGMAGSVMGPQSRCAIAGTASRGATVVVQYEPQQAVILPPDALCCVTLPWIFTLAEKIASNGEGVVARVASGFSRGDRSGAAKPPTEGRVPSADVAMQAEWDAGAEKHDDSDGGLQTLLMPILMGTAPLQGMLIGGTAVFPA